MNFNLPIQKATDREIFDFVEKYIPTIQDVQDAQGVESRVLSWEVLHDIMNLQRDWTELKGVFDGSDLVEKEI